MDLKEFLSIVEKELVKAEKNYREAKKSAAEVAHIASLSPSQAGDRYHSQGTAEIAKARVESLRKLKKEVEDEKARFFDQNGGFWLVENVTLLPGVNLVSVHSEVGKKLNKNVGQG